MDINPHPKIRIGKTKEKHKIKSSFNEIHVPSSFTIPEDRD